MCPTFPSSPVCIFLRVGLMKCVVIVFLAVAVVVTGLAGFVKGSVVRISVANGTAGEERFNAVCASPGRAIFGTYTDPARLVAYHVSNNSRIEGVTLASGFEFVFNCVISHDGATLIASMSTSPAKFVKHNVVGLAQAATPLTLNTGENRGRFGARDLTSTFCFFALYVWPAKCVKIRWSDNSRVAVIDMGSGEKYGYGIGLDTATRDVIMSTWTIPAYAIKISTTPTFARTSSLQLSSGENNGWFLTIADGFSFVSCAQSLGIIVKVKNVDMTRVGALTLSADKPQGSVADWKFLYIVTQTEPAIVVQVRLSDLSEVSVLQLQEGSGGGAALPGGNRSAGIAFFSMYKSGQLGLSVKVQLDASGKTNETTTTTTEQPTTTTTEPPTTTSTTAPTTSTTTTTEQPTSTTTEQPASTTTEPPTTTSSTVTAAATTSTPPSSTAAPDATTITTTNLDASTTTEPPSTTNTTTAPPNATENTTATPEPTRPPSSFVEPAFEATLTVIGGGASVVVASAAGYVMVSQKALRTATLARCGRTPGVLPEIGGAQNPMHFTLGDPPFDEARGTVAGNPILCVGLLLAHLLVAWVYEHRTQSTFPAACAKVYAPGAVAVVVACFMPATSYAAGMISGYTNSQLDNNITAAVSGSDHAVASFGYFFTALTVAWFTYIGHTIKSTQELGDAKPVKMSADVDSCGAVVQHAWTYLSSQERKWIETEKLLMWGLFVESLDNPFFGAIDVAVAVSISGISGVSASCTSSGCCVTASIAVVVLSFAHVVYILVRNPFLVRFERGIFTALSVLNLVIAIVAAIVVNSDAGEHAGIQTVLVAASWCTSALGSLGLLLAILAFAVPLIVSVLRRYKFIDGGDDDDAGKSSSNTKQSSNSNSRNSLQQPMLPSSNRNSSSKNDEKSKDDRHRRDRDDSRSPRRDRDCSRSDTRVVNVPPPAAPPASSSNRRHAGRGGRSGHHGDDGGAVEMNSSPRFSPSSDPRRGDGARNLSPSRHRHESSKHNDDDDRRRAKERRSDSTAPAAAAAAAAASSSSSPRLEADSHRRTSSPRRERAAAPAAAAAASSSSHARASPSRRTRNATDIDDDRRAKERPADSAAAVAPAVAASSSLPRREDDSRRRTSSPRRERTAAVPAPAAAAAASSPSHARASPSRRERPAAPPRAVAAAAPSILDTADPEEVKEKTNVVDSMLAAAKTPKAKMKLAELMRERAEHSPTKEAARSMLMMSARVRNDAREQQHEEEQEQRTSSPSRSRASQQQNKLTAIEAEVEQHERPERPERNDRSRRKSNNNANTDDANRLRNPIGRMRNGTFVDV